MCSALLHMILPLLSQWEGMLQWLQLSAAVESTILPTARWNRHSIKANQQLLSGMHSNRFAGQSTGRKMWLLLMCSFSTARIALGSPVVGWELSEPGGMLLHINRCVQISYGPRHSIPVRYLGISITYFAKTENSTEMTVRAGLVRLDVCQVKSVL